MVYRLLFATLEPLYRTQKSNFVAVYDGGRKKSLFSIIPLLAPECLM